MADDARPLFNATTTQLTLQSGWGLTRIDDYTPCVAVFRHHWVTFLCLKTLQSEMLSTGMLIVMEGLFHNNHYQTAMPNIALHAHNSAEMHTYVNRHSTFTCIKGYIESFGFISWRKKKLCFYTKWRKLCLKTFSCCGCFFLPVSYPHCIMLIFCQQSDFDRKNIIPDLAQNTEDSPTMPRTGLAVSYAGLYSHLHPCSLKTTRSWPEINQKFFMYF